MKATEASLFKLLNGTKQFIIPVYQRTYSWNIKQCQQLWNDVLQLAKDPSDPAHFIGSIVYIEKGIYHLTSVPQLLVIDGQQRLVTVSLLLAALGKAIENCNSVSNINRKKINNYYLFNNEEEGDQRYKLILTKSDKDSYISLIEDREMLNPPSNRIADNYKYFKEQIQKCGIDPIMIYDGVSKLVIVDVSLDRNFDNPQLIFESLNSTGLDLSQADLIRNYILMGLEPKIQTKLYEDYWFPMEQLFGLAEYAKQFDRFIRDYLTIKTGNIPKMNEVYAEFKRYVQCFKDKDINEIVREINIYSKYFVKLALLKEEGDREIKEVLRNINTLKVDVSYPFLLEVYDDYYSKGLLN